MNDLIWKQTGEDEYLSIGGLVGNKKLVGNDPVFSEEDWNKYNESHTNYYKNRIG